jgi:hypothetical protein
VYRSVAIVDRSEYPTLVYDIDQLNPMNGLVGVAFIALNHPYSRYSASAKNCTGGLSVTLQRSDLTLQWLCLTTKQLDQRLSSHGDDMRTVCPWSRTVHGSSKDPFAQLITFVLKQINTGRWTANYNRTIHGL